MHGLKQRWSALLTWSPAACGAQSPISSSVQFHKCGLTVLTATVGLTLASLGSLFCHLFFFSKNLFVNSSSSADIRRCCPGVRLHRSSSLRSACQLHVDDLVIFADLAADLQVGQDAVTKWGRKWRFTLGIRTDQSATSPSRHVPSCSVTLNGNDLPVVHCHFAGPITSTVSPLAALGCYKAQLGRAAKISQSLSVVTCCPLANPQAQCLDWSSQARALQHCQSSTDHSAGGVVIRCCGQRALRTRLSSANWAFRLVPHGLRSRFVLVWPLGGVGFRKSRTAPCSRSSALRLMSLALGPIGVALITHAGSQNSGVGPRSIPSTSRRWFALLGLSALHTVRSGCSFSDFTLSHMIHGSGVDPAEVRWWETCPTRP